MILIAVDDHMTQAFEDVFQNTNGPSSKFSTYRTMADMDGPLGAGRAGREILRNTGDGFMVEAR